VTKLWYCGIPGKKNTLWEGASLPLKILFSDDYPQTAPKLYFPQGFFHPNIYDSGRVCLSIINEEADGSGWKPSVTIKQMLVGVQELLGEPNNDDAAQRSAMTVLRQDKAEYERRVKLEVAKYPDGREFSTSW
jgi:ubiquitin-conjugating enzyme E2 I